MVMSKSAIIIGAGVIGASTAYHLAKSGWKVTVIDKASGAGQGSTSSSSAVIRFNYSTLASTALAWESFHHWEKFGEHLDADAEEVLAKMINTGVVMLDAPPINARKTLELFDQCSIDYEVWDFRTLSNRVPGINVGRYFPPKRIVDPEFFSDSRQTLGAIYTPKGGYINDPTLAAINFADAAKKHGANFIFKNKVNEIARENNRIKSLTLESGVVIPANVIINIAGPWSSQINKIAGVGSDFTVNTRPLRQEVHHVQAPIGLENMPLIGDLDLGTYIRSAPGNSWLIGGTEPECEPLQWLESPDDAHPYRTQELFESQVMRAARRFSELKVPNEAKGVVGVYDVTKDWTPIYDRSELDGYYMAIGTSGNQFKNAPVVGKLMSYLINTIESGHDHDKDPLIYFGEYTHLPINLGAFSRKRAENIDSSGTVMG